MTLSARYCDVRSTTDALTAPLSAEDQTVQSMADVSPTKWHRAHTTWFFEEFLLHRADGARLVPEHISADPGWGYLFNSYYDAVGPRHPRPERGLLSRPPIAAILAWRQRVNHSLARLLERLEELGEGTIAADTGPGGTLQELLELGLQHEQQPESSAAATAPGFERTYRYDAVNAPIGATLKSHPATPTRREWVEGWLLSLLASGREGC